MDSAWLFVLCCGLPFAAAFILWAVASAAKDSLDESKDRFNL